MTSPASPSKRLSPVQDRFRAALLEKIATGEYEYERAETCLCGGTASVQLAAHDRFGIPVGTVLCQSCGLCRTDPRLATKDLPSFYNEIYHGLHQGIADPNPRSVLFRVGQGAAIHSYFLDLLPVGPVRVAEIGCGTGSVLREFQAAAVGRDVDVAGCEYAEAFASAGRDAGTDVRLGGPEALLSGAPYDVVIMSHVAEHFPDPVRGLQEVRGLGHPATLYYVEVPGVMTIHRKPEYGFRLDRYLTLAHTYHFTLRTLSATMARAGFELVRGDEEVRSVFKAGGADPEADPETAAKILRYLGWLERSWQMRVARGWQATKPVVGRAIRTVLGDRLYATIRGRS